MPNAFFCSPCHSVSHKGLFLFARAVKVPLSLSIHFCSTQFFASGFVLEAAYWPGDKIHIPYYASLYLCSVHPQHLCTHTLPCYSKIRALPRLHRTYFPEHRFLLCHISSISNSVLLYANIICSDTMQIRVTNGFFFRSVRLLAPALSVLGSLFLASFTVPFQLL